MDAMVSFNPQDPLTSPNQKYGFRSAAASPEKPKNLGFSLDLAGLAMVSREVSELVLDGVRVIEKHGVNINYDCPDFVNADEVFRPLRAAQFAGMWSHVLKDSRALLKPEVVWNIEQGLTLDSVEVVEAEIKRQEIRKKLTKFS
jgi:amidase